jgi:GT2 family glycosyltransferase/glycosyltransferase involved in cell wall biosynthesis
VGISAGAIRGHVDTYRSDCVSGWAFDPARPDERVAVEVLHNGERLCVVSADLFREDLQTTGHGDGYHGFEIALPLEIFTEPTVVLRIRVANSGPDLLGSPVTLHNHRAQLDESVLQTLGQAIASTAGAAKDAESLAGLAGWLIRHFDVVYQRQSQLAGSARARAEWFKSLIGDNMTLSDMLRQAAGATVERYNALHLPPVEDPDVSVIIAAFNHFDVTYRCLQSIIAHKPKTSFEVILVDDASTDETLYAALVLSGGIHVTRNNRNKGFLHSVAAGAQAARGRFLLLLNNDTEVHEGWLDELVGTFARDPSIGIAGSKLLFPDGRLQEAGGIIWRQASGMNYGRFEDPGNPRYCFMRDCDYVSGAALMIRHSVYAAVGGLSEEFAPGYYEDTDLCFKVRAAGHRVVVQPQSKVTHYEGVSSGTDPDGPGMKRFQRVNQRTFLLKWFDILQRHALSEGADAHRESERTVTRRLLFIDETVPTPDRDAGSNAALGHMRGLQRLGYKVSFVGADNMAKISPYTDTLEGLGIEGYYAPYFWSVEEIFRRERVTFDVIYVHRFVNMMKYVTMIRQRFPEAVIVYNVADLHHLRLQREADIKQSSTIRQRAETLKREELAMVAAADSVIVHSTFEMDMLTQAVPDANVHVVPWGFNPLPVELPFASRKGLAFVGGYNHTPNVDAAIWLVREVMPLVWAQDPDIECVLIGSDMPVEVRCLEQVRVRAIGHLPKLGPALGQLRLTVAPLRYGAGLKGKVLTSMAAGLPCVCTPCAIEGMGLPSEFDSAIGSSAEDLAVAIVLLHQDEAANAALSEAGLKFIAERFSQDAIDPLLWAATQRRPASDEPWPLRGAASPVLVSPEAGQVTRRRRA